MAHKTFRWYVALGSRNHQEPEREWVASAIKIKTDERAEKYRRHYKALIGPFKTKRAALWLLAHSETPLQTVNEIEEEAGRTIRAELKAKRMRLTDRRFKS